MGTLEDSPLSSGFFSPNWLYHYAKLVFIRENKTMIFTNDIITSKLANKVSRINKKPK